MTGGAGFLGSHLCELLLSRGFEVFCLDNFSSGRLENLRRCQTYHNFHLVRHDVCETFLLPAAPKWIYHLACPASPKDYQKDPIHTLKTCVLGALHVLECARQHGSRVLLTSTSEVYGDPLEHPQKETYWGHVNPVGVRACYDEGKRAAETLFDTTIALTR